MTDVSLGPATVNLLNIVENDNWSIALTLTAGSDPYDLTGAVIVAKIKTKTTSYTLTTTVTDPTGGAMTVAQTDAPLLDSSSKWALRINNRTIMSGKATGTGDTLA